MIMNKVRKYVRGIPTFYGIYENFKAEVMTYGGRSWNENTTEQYDKIVLNHIIPYLDDHNTKNIGELSKENYDEVLRKLNNQGKNGPGEPFEAWDANGVPEKVDYLMRAVVWAAANHKICNDCFDPRTHTCGGGGRPQNGREQARIKKCFSIMQELLIVKFLMKILNKIGTAVGLLLQLALGLRNNEACGLNFGYIQEYKKHQGHFYIIVPQTTDLGKRTVKILGKTENSGRKIPLPKPLVIILFNLLDERVKEANLKGYTGLVEDLPIVCKDGKPWERCSSSDLSKAAREMFIQIGMREDDIIALNQELLEEAQAAREELEEDEFREIESDPTAYLLRRNFATHLAKLRLEDYEVCYVIGHKIEDEGVQRRAFNDEKILFALKHKLDERPVLNPIILEQSVKLAASESEHLEGSKKFRIEIPTGSLREAEIDVIANEPGDEINVKVTCQLAKGTVNVKFKSHATPLPEKPNRTIDGTRAYIEAYQKSGTSVINEYSKD